MDAPIWRTSPPETLTGLPRFHGRSAIITGGADGIGFAIAQRLLTEGAHVTLWDVNAERLFSSQAELSAIGQVDIAAIDITDGAAVEEVASKAEARGCNFDILVHSAGIAGPSTPLVDYDANEWKRVMDVNLFGAFLVNQAVVGRMAARGYGRVVNIASIAGKEGNPNASAYSASKAGLIALTKSLGKEMADLDIGVNCITPAAAKTKILEQVSEEHVAYMLSKIPRGRFLELGEICAMVLWLVSAENSFTTGAVFDLSGGRATY